MERVYRIAGIVICLKTPFDFQEEERFREFAVRRRYRKKPTIRLYGKRQRFRKFTVDHIWSLRISAITGPKRNGWKNVLEGAEREAVLLAAYGKGRSEE